MSGEDLLNHEAPQPGRVEALLPWYVIGLSVVMMLMGLRQWAVILGMLPGAPGAFVDMTSAWAVVTVHIAVVDVIVSVGLWNQAAWGKVLWVYAALFEVVIHTVFATAFGADWLLVGFHLVALAVFGLLTLMARRQIPE